MKAIILAGGKGKRLRPYTIAFPKPLMPIGDHPILEIIIQQLKVQGITEITLAVGHLAELIMAFFNDGSKFGVKIKYAKEPNPLGTAGPLASMKNDLNEPFLMMNGDILTTLNYHTFLKYHKESGAVATIALNKRNVYIDFGVAELDSDNKIVNYIEKPIIDYLVSAGIYAFDPKVLEYIQDDQYLDFPDLVKKLISAGECVKGYVHEGYWLDIGRPDDYEKANSDIKTLYKGSEL
jgi:NDP-mannose synthase